MKKSNRKLSLWLLAATSGCVFVFVLAAVILLRIGVGTGVEGEALAAVNVVELPEAVAYTDFKGRGAVRDENVVSEAFDTAVDAFAYKTAAAVLSEGEGNANYSPISLYYALALAASGAEGETAEEMLALLGVADKAVLSEQCGKLYRLLYMDNEVGQLQLANSLWLRDSLPWKEAYVENAAEHFYAEVFSADFDDPQTAEAMSQWISDHTNGLLKPTIVIPAERILTILNTVYFYDEWMTPFYAELTCEDEFFVAADEPPVLCDFMRETFESEAFVKGDGFTRAQLKQMNGGAMVFVLPDEGVSPRELMNTPDAWSSSRASSALRPDPERLQAVLSGGEEIIGEVYWKVPKFRFQGAFDLEEMLQRLGVNLAFMGDADFSGITDMPAFISHVKQETYIVIDENGVEAAAYTSVEMDGIEEEIELPPRADMILNRPFLYAVVAENGELLFVGICENPTVEE